MRKWLWLKRNWIIIFSRQSIWWMLSSTNSSSNSNNLLKKGVLGVTIRSKPSTTGWKISPTTLKSTLETTVRNFQSLVLSNNFIRDTYLACNRNWIVVHPQKFCSMLWTINLVINLLVLMLSSSNILSQARKRATIKDWLSMMSRENHTAIRKHWLKTKLLKVKILELKETHLVAYTNIGVLK